MNNHFSRGPCWKYGNNSKITKVIAPFTKNEQYVFKEWLLIEIIVLDALHIKLALIKNFVKALNTEGNAFPYLKSKFVLVRQSLN